MEQFSLGGYMSLREELFVVLPVIALYKKSESVFTGEIVSRDLWYI